MSGDVVLAGRVPVAVVFCVMVNNIPVVLSFGLEELEWCPPVCTVVKDVVPSPGVESVVKGVEDDLIFDVRWEVVV